MFTSYAIHLVVVNCRFLRYYIDTYHGRLITYTSKEPVRCYAIISLF